MFKFFILTIVLFSIYSCSTSGPRLFNKRSLHEAYSDKISNAGLQHTALGKSWLEAAEEGLLDPANIEIPFKETGYFAADKSRAATWKFRAKRGEKITITLNKKPLSDFIIYLDLFDIPSTAERKPSRLSSADSSGLMEPYEIRKDGEYLLRLQPELLRSGEYTISVSVGPSLTYPIKAKGSNHIKSFWGAARDNGSRKHEGIDMFAPFRTPVVAAADGRITRVNESELGGKVIWMRTAQKDYSLYYAHLDSQIVESGSLVKAGDVLGLMGNTGNARTTTPHLHFGIYSNSGAVDPLPFVDPEVKIPSPVKANTEVLGKWTRLIGKGELLSDPEQKINTWIMESNTMVMPLAAVGNLYYILLPDGRKGFTTAAKIASANTTIREVSIVQPQPLYDYPDSTAARKLLLEEKSKVQVKGVFGNFLYVKNAAGIEGWIPEN